MNTASVELQERPRIGVGVIVVRDGKVLLGKRKGSHGAGQWSFPGGHLEMWESPEDCADRETYEETGLSITNIRRGPFSDDRFCDIGRHYITLFMSASSPSGAVITKEPDKCDGWEWFDWHNLPSPLWEGIQYIIDNGYEPPNIDVNK